MGLEPGTKEWWDDYKTRNKLTKEEMDELDAELARSTRRYKLHWEQLTPEEKAWTRLEGPRPVGDHYFVNKSWEEREAILDEVENALNI